MLPENLRDRATARGGGCVRHRCRQGGKFELGELTLEIAPAKIVSVCGFLKYDQKFVRLSSVTAVDRYPAEPRFEVVYHLHSVERKERVRLKCRLAGADPVIESVTSRVARGELVRARGVRSLRHPVPESSRSAAHYDAGRLGRLPAAQRLSDNGVEGLDMSDAGIPGQGIPRRGREEEGSRRPVTSPHGPQHGTAASFHARRSAPADGTGRRDDHEVPAGYRLPAHRHREGIRGQDLPAGGHPDRPGGLSRAALQQSRATAWRWRNCCGWKFRRRRSGCG